MWRFRRGPRQAWFLVSLLGLMILLPFGQDHPALQVLLRILGVTVMVLGVGAASQNARPPTVRLVLGMVLLGVYVSLPIWHHPWVIVPGFLLTLAFFAHIGLAMVRAVLRDQVVTNGTIYNAVIVYVVTALFFAALYALFAYLHPEAFRGAFTARPPLPMDMGDALYFSICTMATVGYGDIVPVSRVARMLVGIQTLFGVMYPAILIARLVSLYDIQATLSGDSDDAA